VGFEFVMDRLRDILFWDVDPRFPIRSGNFVIVNPGSTAAR
jgi:hypothetical protein